MRLTFLTWLFGLICAAFLATVGYTYVRYIMYAESRVSATMADRLTDLMELLVRADEHMEALQEVADVSALEKTRAMAEVIRLNPDILRDEEALQGLCNDLNVKSIAVTDAQGAIIAALPASLSWDDINQFDDTDSLKKCIDNQGYEVCLRPKDMMDTSVQYTGVNRLGEGGAIILGFQGLREQMVRSTTTFANLRQNFDLGEGGTIIAFKDGALLGDETPSFPTADLISLPEQQARRLRLGDMEYFTYAIRQRGYLLVGITPVNEVQQGITRALYPILLSNAGLFLIIFLLVFFLLQRVVISNVSRINVLLRKITQGDLDVRLDGEKFPVELRKLASCINSMVDALQAYGRKNDEAASRELEVARGIQSNIIPHDYPAFPTRDEFDLYATCRRAKVVGGGFYDYFLLGDDYLCFMVADVSGNGVPAAMFAMHSLSTIRELAHAGTTPIDLITRTNASLCSQHVGMYMSLFYGVLQISTGQLEFVNAGFSQALIRHKGGSYEGLDMRSGVVLGHTAEAVYTTCSAQLESGDHLFIYTEGVVETEDAEHTPFGEALLLETLAEASASATCVADMPRKVQQVQRKYMQGAEQSKDATMLALLYLGKRHEQASLSFAADHPAAALNFLSEHLESVFASPLAISALQQAVQSISDALPQGAPVQLELDYDEEAAEAVLRYPSPAFNPLLQLPESAVKSAEHSIAANGDNILTLWTPLS